MATKKKSQTKSQTKTQAGSQNRPASPVRYKNLIGGKWVRPVSGEYIENRNPADTREGKMSRRQLRRRPKPIRNGRGCRRRNVRRSSTASESC